MPSQTALSATIAYLRFPLRLDHRGALRDTTSCPHCLGVRIQKWGSFAGRQRFRCKDCRRTYSTFTNTPLRYLKRVERWRVFVWCMDGRLTVRRTGALAGIDKNTALRWRHRVLDHWRMEPHRRLRGSVAVDEFWMPLNEKGQRRLFRPVRRHGHAPGRRKLGVERVSLLAAIERDGDAPRDMWIGCSDARVLGASDYRGLLGRRLGHVHEVSSRRGPLCALALFARRMGVAYRTETVHRAESVAWIGAELAHWLGPFRGVATHRLDNYLEWFRRDQPPLGNRVGKWLSPTSPADRARGRLHRGGSASARREWRHERHHAQRRARAPGPE
jgi:transposase-like protein